MSGMRVEQRWHKALVFCRRQSEHRKTMLKVSELALLLVGRDIRGNEKDPVEFEPVRGNARHGQMPKMYWIKRASEQSDFHGLSALPLLESRTFGDATYRLRLARSTRRGCPFSCNRFGFAGADLCNTLSQRVLQLSDTFSGDG